jgi:hypothetical protein
VNLLGNNVAARLTIQGRSRRRRCTFTLVTPPTFRRFSASSTALRKRLLEGRFWQFITHVERGDIAVRKIKIPATRDWLPVRLAVFIDIDSILAIALELFILKSLGVFEEEP